ncbi:A/G-specific DNA-adenine glycosylase [Arcticibacter pallidicorallinus]|uniref:Adenine DNA glycosylase n=2 Tax=Arcticibacter pallidicorallinus TaxID=1259464 RepID=A0A2T0U745_9SPHI|nr:A/G-specific adenine glycosylase [Arcticibacter pallidicorallinus]PRY53741.1 A/G-specific DNA-adenine glycosylase [Arcticibacter pallidicorallinus]
MHFIEEIIAWYLINKRDLPWRNTRDPYIIWLSEIILQQTRVEQGLPYFERFLDRYPTIAHFAAANEDEILNLWQGLGYYSRGRNMHKTSKIVMEEYGGYFPNRYDDLLKLKGVGEYTAAAISSFSAGEAKAVVDGNVFRLLSRFFGLRDVINSPQGKRAFTELANEVINKHDPGTSNQAMMEFGAKVCKPRNPDCIVCPLNQQCFALRNDMITVLPVKKKAQRPRPRYFNYIVVLSRDSILLSKRRAKDIWENLYEFPLFESDKILDVIELIGRPDFVSAFGEEVTILSVHGPAKHQLSHQTIHAQFVVIEAHKLQNVDQMGWHFVALDELPNIAQPKIIFSFLRNFLH